jgi:hypothetical protein
VDPEGELTARSVITWYYMRRKRVEKFMMAVMFSIKKILPAKARARFEALLIHFTGVGMGKMFPANSPEK